MRLFLVTDLSSVWSLRFISKPSISNSVTYIYTGGQVGPDITPASSDYTISGNKNTAASGSAYTFRVALNDKTACRWSDGTTDDITGTYYIKHNYASFTSGWAAGQTVTLAGRQWYIISYSNTGARLLYKSSIGTGNWSTANSTASGYSSTLRGTYPSNTYIFNMSTRLATLSDLGASRNSSVASQYNLGITYWLADAVPNYSGYHYYILNAGTCFGEIDYNTFNIVPALELSP